MSVVTFQWVGTGSAFNPVFGHTSFLVSSGGPRTLLIDCGATVPLRLIQMGRAESITDVLITHMHADHIGGMEGLAFFLYFIKGRHGDLRPQLHLATEAFAQELWDHALSAGMAKSQTLDRVPLTATMDTYFDVRIGKKVVIDGLPEIEFYPTPHVAGMENYGLMFSNGVFYSGDTIELPPHHPRLIFHDCQTNDNGPADVHISYDRLLKGLPPEVRAKTYLTHLNETYEGRNALADGFAGYVLPDQVFEVPNLD